MRALCGKGLVDFYLPWNVRPKNFSAGAAIWLLGARDPMS